MGGTSENIALKTRSELYFRAIFDKYDRDRDGYITIDELNEMIESREYENDIPPHMIQKIHDLHDANSDQKLDFKEFVDMINNPDLHYVFGHYITRYVNWIVPKLSHPSHTVTDGEYEDEYNCYPPAVGMIVLSLVEIIFFCVDEATQRNSTRNASGPVATIFIYEPQQRSQMWRYLTYMFVHIGPFHLVVNLLVQILLGIPLEMVHKWWRVLIVYFCGVLAGSLATSIVDPTVKLAGASGGVYSLITAHVASIIMNWKEMSYPSAQLLVFVVIAGTDIGTAIYNRYILDINEHIGYTAHFAGALAGLLVGINVLRNLSVTKTERIIWWVSVVTYSTLMAMCIIWNAAWPSYFPPPIDSTHKNFRAQFIQNNGTV